ncbi:MAG: hypothetical protein JNL88_06950 [Bacteroidia bacterium]|nr:hypothetical protein [Bacteroidia bacterium]
MILKSFRPFVWLLMLLVFMGSAGWMYTAHLCRMQDQCETEMEACCSDRPETCSPVPVSALAADFYAEGMASPCCIDLNLYYNFPLYPVDKVEIPYAQHLQVMAILHGIEFSNFDLTVFPGLNFRSHGPPPLSNESLHLLHHVLRV